jgi:hypothetical protein
MYLAAGRNALYARQGRASANEMAAQTEAIFQAHTNLMAYYNHTFAGGKWDHFMDQPHIGYRSWQDPARNTLDAVKLTRLDVPEVAAMGVAVEGSESAWPANTNLILPQFDAFNQQRHYIDVFNKGKEPFEMTAAADLWILLDKTNASIRQDGRLWVGIDWTRAPKGAASGAIMISGAGTRVTVKVDVFNPAEVDRHSLRGFVEGEGIVSIEPEHYTRITQSGAWRWIKIEDYGRALSGMRAECPVDSPLPPSGAPCLEYQMYLFHAGTVDVETIAAPTLNFVPDRGLRFAISFDGDPPQTVTLVPQDYTARNGNQDWETSVKDNARYARTAVTLAAPGYHTLKIWMVDPGVVLQKLVINLGGLRQSYLGPPESYRNP